jgi:mono/diheme cytochrome c family protein
VALVTLTALVGCDTERAHRDLAARALDLPPAPGEMRAGEAAFSMRCERCHGVRATGTDSGPPLLHTYYVPSHHADASFVMAVRSGVRAHHWRFGDMPPQPEVQEPEIGEIVNYVRWLQREVGLY